MLRKSLCFQIGKEISPFVKNKMKFSAVAIYLISHVILHFMYRLIAEQARQEHIFSTLKIN